MGYVDLGSYLDDDAIDTPTIPSTKHPAGRSYRIPSPDAATGVRLTAMVTLGVAFATGAELDERDADKLKLDDEQEKDFLEEVLGSAYGELIADGVSWTRIQRLGRYCLLHFTLGPEAAADEVKRGKLRPRTERPVGRRRRRAPPRRRRPRRRPRLGAPPLLRPPAGSDRRRPELGAAVRAVVADRG